MKTEHEEQKLVCKLLNRHGLLYFSVPNGFIAGGRNKYSGINKLKTEGFKNGVPDLVIPEPNKNYHGLFIEMKKEKGGEVSLTQQCWLDDLNEKGYKAVVCNGFIEAEKVIIDYVKEK